MLPPFHPFASHHFLPLLFTLFSMLPVLHSLTVSSLDSRGSRDEVINYIPTSSQAAAHTHMLLLLHLVPSFKPQCLR